MESHIFHDPNTGRRGRKKLVGATELKNMFFISVVGAHHSLKHTLMTKDIVSIDTIHQSHFVLTLLDIKA